MKCLDGSNNVKVYNLTASKVAPEWLSEKKKKKKRKRDDDDLLQDFEMPDISTCIGLSPDGLYLMACGTYKPVMKCYELADLSVKFERGMDAEVLRFEILSEDYSKVAFLQECRYIELHGQGGLVYRNRVPRFGRDIALHYPSADLYVAASGNEIYRLNLFQGRFLNSIDANTKAVNRLLFNKALGLLMCGTDDGILQCWDPRMRTRAGTLDCGKHMMEHAQSFEEEIRSRHELRITSLAHKGLHTMAVGNQTGQIMMYDIRCNSPYLVRDHHTRNPIHSIHFHSSGNVISMAPGVVKIWNQETGEAFTSVEGDAPFNDMAVVPGTGLLFFAAEDKRMKAYFIPSLGPAPSWCPHLDSMTEEMEDQEDTAIAAQFDDYTFVTMADLVELGLRDLVGTSMLRAVMHGYYINTGTYNKAKQLANPVKPINVIKQKVKETIADDNAIQLKSKVSVATNKALLAQATEAGADEPVLDDRFAMLFNTRKCVINEETSNRLDRTKCLSKNKKTQEMFKKRRDEMAREERELEQQKAAEEGDEAAADGGGGGGGAGGGGGDDDSDTNSVLDCALGDASDSDDSYEEKKQQMRKLFHKRGVGARRQR